MVNKQQQPRAAAAAAAAAANPFILRLHRLIEENIRCLVDDPTEPGARACPTRLPPMPPPVLPTPVKTFAIWSARQHRNTNAAGAASGCSSHRQQPQHGQFMDLIGKIVSKVLRSTAGSPPGSPRAEEPLPLAATTDCVSCDRKPNFQTTASKLGRDDRKLLAQTNVSEATFHKIIEFEFNQERDLRRRFGPAASGDSQLSQNEWALIQQYERVLMPLRYSLSAHSRKQARMKDSINRYFLDKSPVGTVSFEQQRKTMVRTAQSGLDLLVSLTKQIDSFSALVAQDQISLLKDNVMQIMTLRSMLLASRPPFPAGCKRPLAFDSDSSSEDDEQRLKDDSVVTEHNYLPPPPQQQQQPQPQPLSATAVAADDQSHRMALEYGQRFRYHYHRMVQAIDKGWQDDPYIFYLVLAILLFQSRQPDQMSNGNQVLQEYQTNIYLLKRYLEHKFQSVCLARTHFIRLFNLIEEIHLMDQHVIQKLLDYNLTYAQNLLERLCV